MAEPGRAANANWVLRKLRLADECSERGDSGEGANVWGERESMAEILEVSRRGTEIKTRRGKSKRPVRKGEMPLHFATPPSHILLFVCFSLLPFLSPVLTPFSPSEIKPGRSRATRLYHTSGGHLFPVTKFASPPHHPPPFRPQPQSLQGPQTSLQSHSIPNLPNHLPFGFYRCYRHVLLRW